MPHRGRLASLVVLNDFPFRNLLYKASGKNEIPVEIEDAIDDMPTHIAISNTKAFSSGDKQKKTKKMIQKFRLKSNFTRKIVDTCIPSY